MNLRDLKYLLALADHKHFGRAAAACFVSQPTLSTQIKKLEDELGVSLVERAPRKVMLTPAGRDAAERARDGFRGRRREVGQNGALAGGEPAGADADTGEAEHVDHGVAEDAAGQAGAGCAGRGEHGRAL